MKQTNVFGSSLPRSVKLGKGGGRGKKLENSHSDEGTEEAEKTQQRREGRGEQQGQSTKSQYEL